MHIARTCFPERVTAFLGVLGLRREDFLRIRTAQYSGFCQRTSTFAGLHDTSQFTDGSACPTDPEYIYFFILPTPDTQLIICDLASQD